MTAAARGDRFVANGEFGSSDSVPSAWIANARSRSSSASVMNAYFPFGVIAIPRGLSPTANSEPGTFARFPSPSIVHAPYLSACGLRT